MYRYAVTEPFPCPAARAFEIATGDLPGIERFVPSIETMKTIKDEIQPDGRRFTLHEFKAHSPLPAVARILFKPEMLRWRQEMYHDPRTLSLDWNIIPFYFTDSVHCRGRTVFVDVAEGSELRVKGSFHLDTPHVPAIPAILLEQIIRTTESFIVGRIKPSLTQFYKGIKSVARANGML